MADIEAVYIGTAPTTTSAGPLLGLQEVYTDRGSYIEVPADDTVPEDKFTPVVPVEPTPVASEVTPEPEAPAAEPEAEQVASGTIISTEPVAEAPVEEAPAK